MSKITGIARIKIDGELIESMPGAELDLGGYERAERTGHRVYGYTEKVVPSTLTCSFPWKAGAPIEMLRNAVEATITFESDVGETYKVSNAFTTSTLKVKDEDGDVSLEMKGDPAVML